MNAALYALADPFGRTPGTTSEAAPGIPAGAAQSAPSSGPSGLVGHLGAFADPQRPQFWFGTVAAATFLLIAVSHGHLGGEVGFHAGPAHASAGIGED